MMAVLQSLAAYNQAIRLEPDARSYYNRHKVYLRLSKLNDALSDLTHAIALDNTFVMVRS
jgi:tetratricopeptide (TPR) repeat protein